MDDAQPLLYWEDFTPGRVFEFGSRALTEEEIVAFAREWDPQYFHTDPQAAKDGPFGGLVASGWQTASVWSRMLVDSVLSRAATMGGNGIDEFRISGPTRPGMRLHGRLTVLEATPSTKRTDLGTVVAKGQLDDDDGTAVLSMHVRMYFRRRPLD